MSLPILNFRKKEISENIEPRIKKKTSKKKKILLALIAMLLIAIAVGVTVFQIQKKKMRNKMEVSFTTETAVITRQTLTNSISATGTIESAETKTVNTKLSNIEVTAVHVKEGDYVEAGTVICEFDSSDYEEALAKAKNNHSVNQQIENLDADYTTTYNKAMEDAEEGLEKVRKARDEAKDAYNEARTNPEVSEMELEALKSAYEQAQTKREEYQEQYEAAVEKAQYDYDKAVLEEKLITETQEEKTIDEYTDLIDKCTVKADMSGVITSLTVTEGNIFEGGNIYTIQDNEHFIVSSTVDEYDISSIQKGMTAYVKTDATGDTEMTGEVTYVAIAPVSNNSGGMGSVSSSASYRIEVTIQNPAENLRAGMTAKISIALEESVDTLTVPYDAITSGPGGMAMITVDVDGEKKTINVKKGLETDYYTEIISDEISEGMTVYLSTPMFVTNPESDEETGFPGMPGGGEFPGGGSFPGGGEFPGGGNFPGGGEFPGSGMPSRGGNGSGMPSGGRGGF